MSIIMNENEWAQQAISNRTLDNRPFETIRRVARYYIDQGFEKKDLRKKVDDFVDRCDGNANHPKMSNTIDKAIKYAMKHPAINVEGIRITKPELEKINALDGTMIRRLAFTLLCLAKYHMEINPDRNYWVNNSDNEIFSLANVKTSIKRQCLLYNTLMVADMIQLSKKVDNTSVRVCFAEEGETVLYITDFRNLGYQYLKYRGEPFFECSNCGIVTKIKDPVNRRRQKYCAECAVKIRTKQNVEATMRYRKRNPIDV